MGITSVPVELGRLTAVPLVYSTQLPNFHKLPYRASAPILIRIGALMSARTGQLLVKPRDSSSLWKNTRKRKAEAFDEKREALLKTAAALFRRYGYAGGSLTDVGACVLLTQPRDLEAKFRHQIGGRIRAADEIIRRILAEGTRDGTLRVPDPAVTLQVLFGSLNWIPRWYKPEGRIKPDDFAKMQVEILMQGVSTARDNGRPKVTTSKARSPKRTKA